MSHGAFRASLPGHADVPMCQFGNAYIWHSSMSIDCDGQTTARCSHSAAGDTFAPDTAVHQSDGRPFNAATTPYVVLPRPDNATWSYRGAGIRPGDVAAVIYNGRVVYAVFADVGPRQQIGEASYATAAALGIAPDPSNGGTHDDVTYILFPHTRPSPVESHDRAARNGRAAATRLASGHPRVSGAAELRTTVR
ncbi:glycoside hydrolase family 75 protein [Streptomyces monashensis]|uniref:glycoside hydrolase family 75 protein n=1 Tax=Streptomyces monashensis TaxID=1678012 RepID=UPI00340DC6C7